VNRGESYVMAPPSPLDKPRPCLVVQAFLPDEGETVTVALITSDLRYTGGPRIPIQPTAGNGLRKASEIMVDNLQTTPIDRIGGFAGVAEADVMRQVDLALRVFLGLF
jgi:mRNA interferase MazF